ncbi:MAG: hypothetical protein WBZ36_17575 [Candidatus Nitrosopolaris sp.]
MATVNQLSKQSKATVNQAIQRIWSRYKVGHIGNYQARVCAHAIIARAHRTITSNNNGESSRSINSYEPWSKWVATADHVAILQVIFTDPQIASVGFTEKDARRLNINVRVGSCCCSRISSCIPSKTLLVFWFVYQIFCMW